MTLYDVIKDVMVQKKNWCFIQYSQTWILHWENNLDSEVWQYAVSHEMTASNMTWHDVTRKDRIEQGGTGHEIKWYDTVEQDKAENDMKE